jgi:hypothetical protein
MATVRNSDALSQKFNVAEIDNRHTGHLDGNTTQLKFYSP